jgi:hypothetical protein
MKHLWSIICNRLIIDEQTNNATLVDVLEEIKLERSSYKVKKKLLFSLILSRYGLLKVMMSMIKKLMLLSNFIALIKIS